MFDKVVEWLEDADEEAYSDRDVRTAVAALYYHMISVDGHVSLREIDRFLTILKEQFALSDDQARELTRRGVQQEGESAGLFPFTAILNREFDDAKRRNVLRHLHELADSDGARDPLERDLLQHIQTMLKLD